MNGELRIAVFLSLGMLASALPAQQPAAMPRPTAKISPPLIDPQVIKLSDGTIRKNAAAGISEAYLPILFPSSHASNLIQLKNGDILCFWFSGTWEGNSGVGIVMSRLAKGAKHWGPTTLIDSHTGESYQNPVPFEAPDGTLHLFHTTQGANAGEANSHVLHLISTDHGKTWKGPEMLFPQAGAFSRHPLLVLPNHSWLLPMNYVTSKGIGEGAETNYSVVKLSKDDGRNWTECSMPGTMGKVQPTIVMLAPNHFVAFLRSRSSDFIYTSSSSDGCHWSDAQPTALPNNNASVQAFRLQNGHIAMVFDNSSADRSGSKPVGGLRKPLSIALSEDEGQSWKYVRDIERGRPGFGDAEQRPKTPGREEYSYPSVMQASDGTIMVAFTYRRQTIKVVSFTEDWIRKGSTVGKYKPTSSQTSTMTN
jgi:predicted neuraminidase